MAKIHVLIKQDVPYLHRQWVLPAVPCEWRHRTITLAEPLFTCSFRISILWGLLFSRTITFRKQTSRCKVWCKDNFLLIIVSNWLKLLKFLLQFLALSGPFSWVLCYCRLSIGWVSVDRSTVGHNSIGNVLVLSRHSSIVIRYHSTIGIACTTFHSPELIPLLLGTCHLTRFKH